MPDFTVHLHPILAVACPVCGQQAGTWCRRPSGHKATELHASRGAEADRVFIEQHGPDAAIRRDPMNGWWIEGQRHVL